MEMVQTAVDRTMLQIAKGWVLYTCNSEEPLITPCREKSNLSCKLYAGICQLRACRHTSLMTIRYL